MGVFGLTLLDLVKRYKGDARFDVNILREDNIEDVVVFMGAEADAIKDAVLNAEVSNFRVSAVDKSGIPTLTVLVRETAEPETPDSTPTDESEKTE